MIRGQVIHDKYVVCDFNGDNPAVFTGSSNLATGGEKNNGDNLLAIHDSEFARAFAVEPIRLVDHYHFRDGMEQATADKRLTNQGASPKGEDAWWKPYYDDRDLKLMKREFFIRAPPCRRKSGHANSRETLYFGP